MKITFDTHGNEKQKDCARAWVDPGVIDIAYGGSKGSAKSYTGASLIFGDALMYPETHYFIARKRLNDLRLFTIPSIHEVFRHWNVGHDYYKFNGQDNYYTLHNGSKVYLLEGKYQPSDPLYYRFGSMQMTRGWIEEAGEFDEDAKNNLLATVGRWKNDIYGINGKILQTCNPSKNYLYREYYKKHKSGTLEAHKRFIQALPDDNKMLQEGYLENLRLTLSKNQRERLLFGNWEYDDDPTALCDYENITDIFKNDHVVKPGVKYLTADVARLGSDKAIVAVWDGWVMIEVHVFATSLMTEIQDCIKAMRTKHQIPKTKCVADEDGVGGGVVDNCGIMGFVNGSKALKDPKTGKEENYMNLQTQMGYKLADHINEGSIWIECDLSDKHQEEIIEELEQLKTYKEDSDGKKRLLPKEKIKENIGRSPDWRDTLLMRKYFDYKKFVHHMR